MINHDFKSPNRQAGDCFKRKIIDATVSKNSINLTTFSICQGGFIRYQVRYLASCLQRIGTGQVKWSYLFKKLLTVDDNFILEVPKLEMIPAEPYPLIKNLPSFTDRFQKILENSPLWDVKIETLDRDIQNAERDLNFYESIAVHYDLNTKTTETESLFQPTKNDVKLKNFQI